MEGAVRTTPGLSLLVNNAGFGTAGPFVTSDIEKEEAEIRLNVLSLVRLCHAAGARLVERKGGGIINVSIEYLKSGDRDEVRRKVEQIPVRLEQIWAESDSTGRNPADVADTMAQRLIGR